jgi:glutamate synthase domain-containing protein 3
MGLFAIIAGTNFKFMRNVLYLEDFLKAEPCNVLGAEAHESIHGLVQLHAEKTARPRAYWLLSKWDELAPRFIRLTPKPQA